MRDTLEPSKIDNAALLAMGLFHSDIVKEVQDAVAANKVVVVGMAQNPVVKKARAALDAAKIKFTYLEYGSYFSKWRPRLAIKLWSGWPTFPQVFINGKLIWGCDQLQVWLKNQK